MAFTPTVESANRAINQSRQLYQAALDGVAEGRQQLQNEVDAGRLVPGTQEFLNARNKLVNSAQAYADTVKLQYDEDLSRLDLARAAEQNNVIDTSSGPVRESQNFTVSPTVDPEAQRTQTAQADQQIVPAEEITPNAYQEAGNIDGYGAQNEIAVPIQDVRTSAQAVTPSPASGQIAYDDDGFLLPGYSLDENNNPVFVGGDFVEPATLASAEASRVQVGTINAQDQQTNSDLAQFPLNTDWRVTLRLAPNSNYLYNAPQAGILQPLKTTNGVIFPFTPQISTAYKADYSPYDLTHSNYRGYFYKNSYTDTIQLQATFTAQSTADAAYVLAVIHFFRSVTKMFYGQDAQRGSPPPLVFLSGLGDYQFNNHPCLVSQFNYTLPPDVDYISSGTPNNLGLNLQPLQNLYSTTLNAVAPTVTRLAAAFLPRGAQNEVSAPLQALLNNPTYVPTKIDMTIALLPVQTRSQVSKQFSLKNFANGNLLKGGFW